MIENPFLSRKFHGEYEPIGIGYFELEERHDRGGAYCNHRR